MKFVAGRVRQTSGSAGTDGIALAGAGDHRICFVVSLDGPETRIELFFAEEPGVVGTGIVIDSGSPFQFDHHYYGPLSARGVGGTVPYRLAEFFY